MSIVLYSGIHRDQFDGSPRDNENCTPTTGANGARCSTGGKVDKTGGQVRALLRSDEETDPQTPGWSLIDLDLAMSRLNVPFDRGTGGWSGVRAARTKGLYVVLQGDSEEFPNGTCSGRFNGDHCVGVPPDNNGSLWGLDDPICRFRRWESEAALRRYASNFNPEIRFGAFTTPVPALKPPPVIAPTGWVRVTGAWWVYDVNGNPTTGYAATTRDSKTTKGWSASVGQVIEASWGGRDRVWAEVLEPSAYAGTWVDTLDNGSIRHIAA